MSKMFTVAEVAENLKVSQQTIFNWMRNGKLRSVKLGRARRFREEDLKQFIERGATAPAA